MRIDYFQSKHHFEFETTQNSKVRKEFNWAIFFKLNFQDLFDYEFGLSRDLEVMECVQSS
jgi:hypothetical protein